MPTMVRCITPDRCGVQQHVRGSVAHITCQFRDPNSAPGARPVASLPPVADRTRVIASEPLVLERHPEPLTVAEVALPLGTPAIQVREGEDLVAQMELDDDLAGFRQVMMIRVNAELRRRGIATAMWNYAERRGLNPMHSDDLSEDAEGWVAGMGHTVE